MNTGLIKGDVNESRTDHWAESFEVDDELLCFNSCESL